MRKILLLLFLSVLSVWGTQNTLIGSGLWSNTAIWSAGVAPRTTDTVIRGAFNDTMEADYTITALICNAGVSGTEWRNGHVLTVTGDGYAYADTGTGTRNFGTGLTASGASAIIVFGSTLGAVAATNCVLTMNGTTGMTLKDNKGVNAFFSLVLGASAKVTSSGSTYSYFTSMTPLVLGNNSTFTNNIKTYFRQNVTGTIFTIGTGVTWNGTDEVVAQTYTSSVTTTFPAITYTGSGIWYMNTMTGISNTFQILAGNINLGTATLELYSNTPGNTSTDLNGYNLTCGLLRTGNQAGVSGTWTLYFRTGIITVTSFDATYWTSGVTTNIYELGSAQISCSGSWKWWNSAYCTVNPGTSTLTKTGSGLITNAGKYFGNLTLNNSGAGTTKNADSTLDSLDMILIDGRDSLVYTVRCRDWINNNADSTFINNLFVSRDFTRNSAYSKRIGGSIWFVNGNNHTMTVIDGGTVGPVIHASAGKNLSAGSNLNLWRLNDSLGAIHMQSYSLQDSFTLVQDTGCQFAALYVIDSLKTLAKKHIAINDTSWLQRFILGDSTRVTVRAGKGMKIGTYTAGDIEGAIGNRTSFMSDTAGKRFRLWLPASDTLQYGVFRDCSTNVVIYLDSTSETKGNNRKIKSLSTYPSSLVSITPASGVMTGGTTVTIVATGGGFAATGSGALVGGLAITDVVRVDYKTITGKTVAHVAGVVSVQPFNSDADTVTKTAAFEYLNDAPVISSISPARGTPLGGTADTINGSSFGTSGTLKWNGGVITPVSWADTKIALVTPAGHDSVEVIVTTVQGSDTVKFSYDTIPVFSSASPMAGKTVGGTKLKLVVTYPDLIDSINIGGTVVTKDSTQGDSLWVHTPAHAAGTVDIITIARYGYRDTVSGFLFAAIYGQALSDRAKCGDTAQISASWGLTGITHVHVGDSVANVLAGASDTLVRFLWPCYTKGRVDVTATATAGEVTFTGGANYSRKRGGLFGLGLWTW